jgi:hypothetical protein
MVQVKKIIERIGSLIENTIEGRKQNNRYQKKIVRSGNLT